MEKDKMREYPNKLKLLYLKQILEQYTDDVNGLTHAEIMKLLKKKGVEVQPRTLRDDLQCLQDAADDFDMRIETNIQDGKDKAHPIQYRAEERLFTPTEVKLLMESVKGIHSLSSEQTEKLHKKLESLVSNPTAQKIRERLAVVGGFKAYWSKRRGKDILLTNIEVVDKALDEKKQIEFRYYWYSMQGKPTYPRDKSHKHVVSPLVRVLEKGFYYLVALDEEGYIKHFRMDRMTNTAIVKKKAQSSYENEYDDKRWAEYVNSSFGLGLTYNPYNYKRWGEYHLHEKGMNNRCCTVHMQLTRDLVGVIMDRFGSNVTITPYDKGHFTAVVKVYHNAQFVSWILSLGNKVKILEPERLVDDISYYARATGRWHMRVRGD